MTDHPHEHTTHTLRGAIEALPRYNVEEYDGRMEQADDGRWLKLSDVRAVVHKAATLAAPVTNLPEHSEYAMLLCGCVVDEFQTIILCQDHSEEYT